MHLSLAIALGLTGAVCWGGADFAARFASRRVGAYRTLFFMQFFGFIALSIYLKFRGGFFEGVAPGWHPWALAALAGVINMIASLSLYYSFQIGVMSIVGPVSSAYPALTVALAIASGERITALRAAGLAVTLVGVILAATTFTQSAAVANETAAKEGATRETVAKESAVEEKCDQMLTKMMPMKMRAMPSHWLRSSFSRRKIQASRTVTAP